MPTPGAFSASAIKDADLLQLATGGKRHRWVAANGRRLVPSAGHSCFIGKVNGKTFWPFPGSRPHALQLGRAGRNRLYVDINGAS